MDKKFVVLAGIFFVLFGLFLSLVFFQKELVQFTRAKQDIPSGEKSIMFAWPLNVPADGQTESVITVFVRNEEGNELRGRTVTVNTNLGQFQETTLPVDKLGKVEFKIKSDRPGTAQVKAVIDNSTPITHTVTIEFTPS